MRWVRRILGLAAIGAVFVCGWVFPAQNATPVTVSYIFGELDEVALWQALCGAFAAGVGLAGLVGAYQIVRLQMVTRRYRKTVRELETEVHQMRNLPLSPEEPPALDPGPLDVGEGAAEGALERGV